MSEIKLQEGDEVCEQALSRGSFLHFLRYVKIVQAPTLEERGGVIGLEYGRI